jgi:DNA-binding NtrC family response regulator
MFSSSPEISVHAAAILEPSPAPFSSPILIVEDDESIRGALNALLESFSIYATWAGSSSEATEWLDRQQEPPKLVIVDGRLPDRHGLELLSELRERLPRDTEMYLFSAEAGYEPQMLARAGVTGFLRKPFDTDRLIDLAVRHAHG